MTKNANYTDEMVETMLSMYEELGNDGIDVIAEKLDKTIRSVRSKLVREGAYKVVPKGAIRQDGPSKKELLREIEAHGVEVEGFEGATKVALNRLLTIVAN